MATFLDGISIVVKYVNTQIRKTRMYLILRSAQLCIVASLARQFPGLKVVGEEGEQVMISLTTMILRMMMIDLPL